MRVSHIRTSSDPYGLFVACIRCGALRPIRSPERGDVVRSGKLAEFIAPVARFRAAHAECKWALEPQP